MNNKPAPIFSVTAEKTADHQLRISMEFDGTRPDIVWGLAGFLSLMVRRMVFGEDRKASPYDQGYSCASLLLGLQQDAFSHLLTQLLQNEPTQEGQQQIARGMMAAIAERREAPDLYSQQTFSNGPWQ